MNITKVNFAGHFVFFISLCTSLTDCKEYKNEDRDSATVKSLLCDVGLWS